MFFLGDVWATNIKIGQKRSAKARIARTIRATKATRIPIKVATLGKAVAAGNPFGKVLTAERPRQSRPKPLSCPQFPKFP